MHKESECIFAQIKSATFEKQEHLNIPLSPQEEELWKIWEQLHKSRALEITTQWQRSVFLSTFITLLLTGNAFFFYHFVLIEPIAKIAMKHCLTGMIIGLLLVVSAILWFAMTKGSKYWTNHYERKIDLIEKHLSVYQQYAQFKYLQENFVSPESQLSVDGKSYCLGKPIVPDLSFWKLEPDNVSPSKVNIFIGYLVGAVGIISILFYTALLKIGFRPIYSTLDSWIQSTGFVPILLAIIIIVIFLYGLFRH